MRRDHLNITEPLEDQVTFIVKYLDLSTLPPPLPSPAQVINSDQFLMIQQLIVVIR